MGVKVKICGVTDPANAVEMADLGVDYLGLNFCEASPRFVKSGQAREIADAVRGRVELVGVFVNAPAAEVERIASEVGLDRLQFSGDEEPEVVVPFAAKAIKAFRTGGPPRPEDLASFEAAWGILIDAPPHGNLYGGTGKDWDYSSVAPTAAGRRLFLAGGIGPDNVRQAVRDVRPYAVDASSRVESAPGIKDPERVRRLIEEVRHGETQTPP